MKARYKIAIWALVAVAGTTILGGSLLEWLVGITIGKVIARLALVSVMAIVVYLLIYALIFGGVYWLLTI